MILGLLTPSVLAIDDSADANIANIELSTGGGSELPSLRINIPMHQIDRNDWSAAVGISLEGSGAYDFGTEETVTAQVRGRGNSTWVAMGDKRPIRFRFPSGEARAMFGSDYVARDWTLIANTLDFSLHRNYGAYFL